jgi:transcriptional antiterminator NusG
MKDRDRRWHLVQVSDGFGISAIDWLKRVQIDVYRPLIRTMKPVPRKKLSRAQRNRALPPMREKITPFFPGYAFLALDQAGERWREIFKITHIRGLVCSNNLPVHVPFEMIEQIRSREDGSGLVPAETKLFELPFFIGERVRVGDGPFASFPGTVTKVPTLPTMTDDQFAQLTLDQLDESFRVHLLVDIFGRQTPVALHVSQIDKL